MFSFLVSALMPLVPNATLAHTYVVANCLNEDMTIGVSYKDSSTRQLYLSKKFVLPAGQLTKQQSPTNIDMPEFYVDFTMVDFSLFVRNFTFHTIHTNPGYDDYRLAATGILPARDGGVAWSILYVMGFNPGTVDFNDARSVCYALEDFGLEHSLQPGLGAGIQN